MNGSGRWGWLLVILPLLVGFAIYANCRDAPLLYERLFRAVPFLHWSSSKQFLNSRCHALLYSGPLANWLIYSLPNALWVFSTCCFLKHELIYMQRVSTSQRVFIYAVIAVMPEVLQSCGILVGTFDQIDLILSLLIIIFVEPFCRVFSF